MRVSFHLLPHCWGFLALPHGSCKCGQFLKKNLETLKSIEGILINISTKDSWARLCGLGSRMLPFYTAFLGTGGVNAQE